MKRPENLKGWTLGEYVVAGIALVAGPALAQQRLPTIPPEQYTAEQKKAAEDFLAARKVPVFRSIRTDDAQSRGYEHRPIDGRLSALPFGHRKYAE